MEQIDEKDRKILVELDKDARQADSKIAKKIRLSKQVTNYRIKRLEKEIIKNFYTVVDVGKIGFSSYYVFLQLQNLSETEEKSLMGKIKEKDYVGWLVNGTGRWDAVVLIYAKSSLEFDRHLNNLLELCEGKVHESFFTSLISAEHIGYKFLGKRDYIKAIQSEKKSQINLDEIDKDILKVISQNARLSIVEMSQKIKRPIHVIRYHLKELLKKGVVEAFKPKIEVNKLGYQWHLLLIQFSTIGEERKQDFINFCKNHRNVYYVTNTLGTYNLMLDIHVKNTEEFKKVLFELKEKYSDVIKLYESLIIFEEYKIDYFTSLFN